MQMTKKAAYANNPSGNVVDVTYSDGPECERVSWGYLDRLTREGYIVYVMTEDGRKYTMYPEQK